MLRRTWLLGSLILGAVFFTVAIAYTTADRRGAQAAQRQANLREARLSLGLSADLPKAENGIPSAEATKTEHEFGPLLPNSESSARFTIRNIGTANLTLHLAGVSCSCLEG